MKRVAVPITSASGPGAETTWTTFSISLGDCQPPDSPPFEVIVHEDADSVALSVTGLQISGDAHAACAGTAVVTLAKPLGMRLLVDAFDGHEVVIENGG